MKREARESPNPKRSPEIPDERKHSLQRFANLTGKSGENRPLGEWRAVEKRRGTVEVKIRDRTVFDRPPRGI
jgi:hypothetical protein